MGAGQHVVALAAARLVLPGLVGLEIADGAIGIDGGLEVAFLSVDGRERCVAKAQERLAGKRVPGGVRQVAPPARLVLTVGEKGVSAALWILGPTKLHDGRTTLMVRMGGDVANPLVGSTKSRPSRPETDQGWAIDGGNGDIFAVSTARL